MEALAAMDALLLAGERLGSAMHVGAVLIMTPPAEAGSDYVDELHRQSLLDTHRLDPRLSRHPHRGVETGGIWVWRQAREVDLRRHLRRITLPAGSDTAQMWELISRLHGERLDMAAPLWTSCLIDGLPDGRFAFYIKIHHIVIDGIGGLRMISDSLSPDPSRRSMPPFYADKSAPPHRRPGLPNPLAAVRAVANAAAAGLDLSRRATAAEVAAIVGTLTGDSVTGPLAAPHTRFNASLGPDRAAVGISLDRSRIHAVRHAAAVTANDVVTAVVAGALRSWMIAHDELPHRTLVAMCPVSARTRDEDGSTQDGNLFGLGLCPLGTDMAAPAERLALIHRAMAEIKHRVAAQGPEVTLAVMGPAIASTVAAPLLGLGSLVPPSSNLAISSVPGPRERMYFNGALLEDIFPVSSAFDGMGLNVTVCSYAERLEIGYVTDPEIMPGVAELTGLTGQALTELEAAVGVSTP